MLKIPYGKLELLSAFISLEKSDFTEKKVKEIGERFGKEISIDKKETNQRTAESNGITVEQLINSPNYKLLCNEYNESVLKRFVNALVKEAGMRKKQAWAMLAYLEGLLD